MADVTVTLAQAYALARAAGFGPAQAVIMAAIAKAESGLRIAAHNTGTALHPEDSRGLWQINVRAHPWADPALLLTDPLYNARAAYRVYTDAGSRYTPWSVYTSGAYRANIADASAASNGVDATAQANPGTPAAAVDWHLPGPVADALGGAGGVLGDILDKLGVSNPIDRAVGAALTGAGRLMIEGLLLAGGVVLVVLGVSHAVAATPVGKRVRAGADDAVKTMAAL
jgi:hypothetical protein